MFLNECRQLGIAVLVPDVNESLSDFSVRPALADEDGNAAAQGAPGAIRFGLSAVRNVGEGVVALIVAAREESGPFTDFHDFCERVDPGALNKRTIESLIKAGGFDSLGHPRQGLFEAFEHIIEGSLARRRERDAEGQFDLFSAVVGRRVRQRFARSAAEIPDIEFPKSMRLALEKEMLGLYVSDHPLMGAQRTLRRHTDSTLTELKEGREGEMRVVGGIVTALSRKYTKRGDLMATFVLEDLSAAVEVMVFPKTMTDHGHALEDDAIVCVKGRIDQRDDMPKLIAMEITRPEVVLDGGPPVRIRAKLGSLSDTKVARLKEILGSTPATARRSCTSRAPTRPRCSQLGDEFCVDATQWPLRRAPHPPRRRLHRLTAFTRPVVAVTTPQEYSRP